MSEYSLKMVKDSLNKSFGCLAQLNLILL